MGKVSVKLEGSFVNDGVPVVNDFSAMTYGHAEAIARAIQWLSESVLPRAIKLDHELHEKGMKPSKGFGE